MKKPVFIERVKMNILYKFIEEVKDTLRRHFTIFLPYNKTILHNMWRRNGIIMVVNKGITKKGCLVFEMYIY